MNSSSSSRVSKEFQRLLKRIPELSRQHLVPYCGQLDAQHKKFEGGTELVTFADRAMDQFLLPELRERFPGSYSEESLFEDRFDHDLIFQVDPLDGTQEYLEGNANGYAVHVAALKRTNDSHFVPIAGLLHQPGRAVTWYSYGGITRCLGLARAPVADPPAVVRGYVRKVDPNDQVERFYHLLGEKLGLPVELVAEGGSGASVAALLEGRLNIIVMNYDYTKEWDVAMAEPLVRGRSSKGFICDLDGKEFSYNRRDPFNRRGYVMSLEFSKKQIFPLLGRDEWLIKRLGSAAPE